MQSIDIASKYIRINQGNIINPMLMDILPIEAVAAYLPLQSQSQVRTPPA